MKTSNKLKLIGCREDPVATKRPSLGYSQRKLPHKFIGRHPETQLTISPDCVRQRAAKEAPRSKYKRHKNRPDNIMLALWRGLAARYRADSFISGAALRQH